MDRILDNWYSPSLDKHMEIVVYGHQGFPLLMFPSAGADYLEYERFLLIDAIRPQIEAGRVRVFSINSINNESWLNDSIDSRQKIIRHMQYNNYITNEVIPYVGVATHHSALPITCGVSLGAFHAANSVFRRPDLFGGTISMSGIYDLKSYSKGYYDDDVYFNSPMDYLPRMHDGNVLNALRTKQLHFLSGKGSYEAPQATWDIADVLGAKQIPNNVEMWDEQWGHDWPTWRAMLPSYLDRKFS